MNKLQKIILTLLLAMTFSVPVLAQDEDYLEIDDLLEQVQISLRSVQQYPSVRQYLPELATVGLDLNTSFTKEGKAKVNFFFFSVGGGVSSAETQNIKLTLAPPSANSNEPRNISANNLAAQLTQIILSAAEGVVEASKREPPLEATALTVSLKFGVVKEAEGGASFSIRPVTFEVGGGVNASEVQTITLDFRASE